MSDDLTDEAMSPAEAAWPFKADSPHVEGLLREDAPLRTLLVDLCGLSWAEAAPHIQTGAEAARAKGMVPVFVTDLTEYSGLRAARVVYDVLPNAAALSRIDGDLDWHAYIRRRCALLEAKWRPSATIKLGPQDAVVAP